MSRLRIQAVVASAFGIVALSLGGLAQSPASPVAKSAFVDSAQLLVDLKALSVDEMEGRKIGTAGGVKARTYVIARFRDSGVTPFGGTYLQPFGAEGGANVVGYLKGSSRSDRYIIVSAHYDHVGVRNGQVFNGADDNASGTAALFAIATYFRTHVPSSSLIFAAFDGEEAGLLGSRAFVSAPPVDRASIVVNVNADMIGRDPNNTLWAVGVFRQPFLRPYIERVAKTAPVKLLIGHDNPAQGNDDWTPDSDQFSFLQAGIPALYLGVEDESQHHRATDDYETMTHDFYVRAVETVILMVKEFDQNIDAIANERQRPRR